MPVVEPRNVRKQHQQLGPEQGGDQGRQLIVVAETRAELRRTDGVVFVDHRHGAILQEHSQRVADVEIAGAVREILGHEQDLGDVPAMAAERPLPGLDEAALANGRHRLEVGEFRGPSAEPEPSHAGGDGARTDEHDLAVGVAQGVDLSAE